MAGKFSSFFSMDSLGLRPSAIRRLARVIADPAVISFAGGVPSPDTFPAVELSEIARRVVAEGAGRSLQYGATKGLAGLRWKISEVCSARRIEAGHEDILVTTGSQQALSLITMSILDPGDSILVELPTYVGALSSMYARRAQIVGVEQDENGLVLESLESTIERLRRNGTKVKAVYTIPNFQNPSGRLLSQERRERLVAMAREHDILVIEDDPYGEISWGSGETRPLRSLPESDRVIYLGSFSKILAPGIRCGFIVAHPDLLARFELAKEGVDLCSSILDQSIVEAYLESGALPAQIERVCGFYRERWKAMDAALSRHLGDRASWTQAEGGLFTFVTLHREVDTAAYLEDAVARGVAWIPGGAFFVDGSGANTMRLTFAKEPPDRIETGVKLLGEVFDE